MRIYRYAVLVCILFSGCEPIDQRAENGLVRTDATTEIVTAEDATKLGNEAAANTLSSNVAATTTSTIAPSPAPSSD
jgi:hypothetical protein